MSVPTLTEGDLAQFTGSETFYRHGLITSVTYTEGVQYVAQKAQAYWLIDCIAIAQRFEASVRVEAFQVWQLSVTESHAFLACSDGDDHTVYQQDIAYTDFPLPQLTLWCVDHVIMLPSEY